MELSKLSCGSVKVNPTGRFTALSQAATHILVSLIGES